MLKYLRVLVLFFTTFLSAQNCQRTLEGVVLDLHDNSRLTQAKITIEELNISELSDESGRYSFANLCDGTYTLLASHKDCEDVKIRIKIKGNLYKKLELEHHYEELNEIIVKGNQRDFNGSSLKQRIDNQTITSRSNESLGELLTTISGVSKLSSGKTIVKPVIHGLHSSRITIMNSGVRMEDQEWGSEHAPSIDINQTDRIEVIKNSSALQFSGDAIGGVILLTDKKIPVKDTLFGQATMFVQSNGIGGGLNSSVIKSSSNGWFTSVNGSIKRYGDFKAPDYSLTNTGMESYGLKLRLGQNRFKKGFEVNFSNYSNQLGILRASHLGGAQDQFSALNNDQPMIIEDFSYSINNPRQDINHKMGSILAYIKSTSLGKIDFRYDLQQNSRLEYDVRRANYNDRPALDLLLTTHSISIDLIPNFSDFSKFKFGLTGRYQENKANPNTGVKRLIPDYKRYDLGGYALADKKISKKLSLDLGLRADYMAIKAYKYYYRSFWDQRNYSTDYSDIIIQEIGNQILVNPKFNYFNVSTSSGLKWSYGPNTVMINLSLSARNPNPSELFSEGLHHSASRIEIGDLRFSSEVAKNLSLGYTYDLNFLKFSINPFLRRVDDFIILEPTSIRQTIRGNFQVWEYRQTNVNLIGVDYEAYWDVLNDVRLEQQLSVVKSYEIDSKAPLINMPPVNLVHKFSYGKSRDSGLLVSLEHNYTFRQNEFPNVNYQSYIPETDTIELIDISTPPEAFHLINLSAATDVEIFKAASTRLTFRIENLMNTSYRNYLNSMRFYADELGRNLVLNISTIF